MGTYFYAVSKEKKQYFELGKGVWSKLCNAGDMGRYMIPGRMECSSYEKVLGKVWDVLNTYEPDKVLSKEEEEKQNDEEKRWAIVLAKSLFEFGPNIEIHDDSAYEDPIKGCEMIGSIYDLKY